MRFVRFPLAVLALLVQSIMIGLGQIRSRKSRSLLTTIGIVIGVASVAAVIAGLTGFRTKILKEFEDIGVTRISAFHSRPDTGPRKDAPWEKLIFYPEHIDGLLAHCPAVDKLCRYTYRPGDVIHGAKMVKDADIKGYDPTWPEIDSRSIVMGRPFSALDLEESRQVCIVGEEAIEELMLDRDPVGQTILIEGRTFTIIGVVGAAREGMLGNRLDDLLDVYVPFTTNYDRRDCWIGIQILAKSPEVVQEARAQMQFFFRKTRGIKPGEPDDFRVEAVQYYMDGFNKIAAGVTAVAACIVAISLLVGGIGIMNIMLVSVSERTREIGLRKALGARPSAICFQFLVEAVMLSFFGGLVGLGLAQLAALAMSSIPSFPLEQSHIPAWAVALSFGFAASVGVFFGFFPAVKAARMNPIEALRYE